MIRSLEPLEGTVQMEKNRSDFELKRRKVEANNNNDGSSSKIGDLCKGPGRLCRAMGISKAEFNAKDFNSCPDLYILEDKNFIMELDEILASPRIGISAKAAEWQNKPLRYFLKDNKFVSGPKNFNVGS